MADYIKLIGDYYPEKSAHIVNGADPTIYSNIIWGVNETPISQATLDSLTPKVYTPTIIVQDTLLNRPTASINGRIFISTDTKETYRDTGSGWVLVKPASSTDINIPIYTNNNPYRSSASTSYIAISRFIYRGLDDTGMPSAIKIICWGNNSNHNYSIRILDVTNSSIIANVDGLSNNTMSIVDMGTLSNIPSNNAILEFQIKSSTTSLTTYVSAIQIQF